MEDEVQQIKDNYKGKEEAKYIEIEQMHTIKKTECFYDMAKPCIFKRVKNTQNSIKHFML